MQIPQPDYDHAEYLKRTLAESQWFAICRVCGKRIEGTPKEIAEHTHDHATE